MPQISCTKFLQSAAMTDAYDWVSAVREHYTHNDSVWFLRRDFASIKQKVVQQIHNCEYQFTPVKKVTFEEQSKPPTWVWDAQDAWVLKSLSLYLQKNLLHKISKKCLHVKDHGGISKGLLGISKGCPLSPLIGALYLSELDEVMTKLPVIYCRFMDDWIILTKTRWHLRKAIKLTNQLLNTLKVEKHPDKTYIGRSKNGFDFLGFHITQSGISDFSISTKTKMINKLHKIYEQKCNYLKIQQYIDGVRVWVRGVLSQIKCLKVDLCYESDSGLHLHTSTERSDENYTLSSIFGFTRYWTCHSVDRWAFF